MPVDNPSADEIFDVAVRRAPGEDRAAYLEEACGDDIDLRRRVERLLRAIDDAGSFLESPAAGSLPVADQLITEKPGTQIGPYKLREQIGEGGFGVVYVAEQEEPVSRKVALKVIKPGMDTKEVIARFEAERQTLALMDHTNVAKMLDAGATASGRPYFVMELVHGVPITEFCDGRELPIRQRLQLFVDVCRAVQHAHQKGIIHRDLKPSNLMVTMSDGRPIPKVIDFGVSKALSQKLTDKTVYTAYGQMVGTPLYMSPEQAEMAMSDVDTRSDVYSLGVVLYELLTGTTPFDKKTLQKSGLDEFLRIVREDEPPRPSAKISTLRAELLTTISDKRKLDPRKLGQSCRGELDWIVLKALEKDRSRRYESASSLADDVGHYLAHEQVLACPPSAGYRLRKFARRNHAALLVAGLILFFLMLLGSGIGWTLRDRVARQARVSEQVELILDEVGRFEQEQKWAEALAAAKRAEAALAGGEAPHDVQARVHQVVSDLDMVARLEEIRLLTSEVKNQGFDYEGANRHYAAALREHGVDVDALPVDEAARRLRLRAAVLPALIVALDDWASCRQAVGDEAGGKALVGLVQVLDTDPWRRRVREALAAKNEQALEELARSEEVARQTPSAVEILAGSLEYCGRRDLASEVLGRALREHPGDFWLHSKAAAAHSSSHPRRLDEAIRHYTAALAVRPGNVAANYNLGNALKAQGNLDEAIACYRRAIQRDPTFAMAHTNLGAALKGQGKLDEAIACYRQAIELGSEKTQPHFAHANLGNALREKGQLDEAIACFRQAIELEPKFTGAHMNLGTALNAQGKLDEAIACFRQAIEIEPKLAMAHSNMGVALFAQRKLSEAIACFRQATELEPHDAAAHYNLGIVLEASGKLSEAIACYRQVIDINPKLAPVYNNLAWNLATADESELRDPTEALQFARKSVQLDPKPWGSWDTLSVAAYRAGDWKASLNARQEKLERHPITLEDRWFLALTHWQLGNQVDARKSYDEAVVETTNEETISPRLSSLHREAKQLLGITTSTTQPEGSDPPPEE